MHKNPAAAHDGNRPRGGGCAFDFRAAVGVSRDADEIHVPAKPPIFGETLESLSARLAEAGEPAYRARQVLDWIYKKRAAGWDADDQPAAGAARAAGGRSTISTRPPWCLNRQSADVTDKLLLELRDRSLIETVIIRAPQEGVGARPLAQDHLHLDPGRLRDGVRVLRLRARRAQAQPLRRGDRAPAHPGLPPRGRPHAARPRRARLVRQHRGHGHGRAAAQLRRPAARPRPSSTPTGASASAPAASRSPPAASCRRSASSPASRLGFRLAVSLHGATNEVREQIMPVNRRWPLEELLPAVREFCRAARPHGHARVHPDRGRQRQPGPGRPAFATIAHDLHAHVNLIPYNAVEGLPWKRPGRGPPAEVPASLLEERGVSVTLRREKGHDIDAACGQLRLRTEVAREAGHPGPPEAAFFPLIRPGRSGLRRTFRFRWNNPPRIVFPLVPNTFLHLFR